MITVAVVEDDPCDRDALRRFIEEAAAGLEEEVCIACFSDGLEFAGSYSRGTDIAFLDIDMPGLNGVETARRIRDVDQDVCLVFVTNMYQFALEGYFGNALDNAIAATRALPDPADREIKVRVQARGSLGVLTFENPYVPGTSALESTGGGAQLPAPDEASGHGYGMGNMRRVVESYGGALSYAARDGVCLLTLLVPLPKEPQARSSS